nr:adenosylcobinamide-phosphate synthase CbiB [Kurthia massiliensis]
MVLYHLIACTIGFIIDRFYGEPKWVTHPVIYIGNLIRTLTRMLNKGQHRKLKGALTAMTTILLTGVIVGAIVYGSYQLHAYVGIGVEALLIACGLAQKSLRQAANDVYEPLVAGDFERARQKLGWIVGRDTAHLDEANITRGVVETVSENTSDGVTAPLFYALLFGATGLWVYKAINTLDSMIAYRNETYGEFGFVAAKLDDLANFIPSRMTGFLLLVASPNDYKLSFLTRFKRWLADAPKHPSPNSGYLEAATAYQLGIQLGGLNYYGGIASHRQEMGEPYVQLSATHIQRTVVQMERTSLAFLIVGLFIGGMFIVT